VSFSGTGLDPDGNIPLVFSWDFGGGAASRTVEDPGAVTFATAGTYTVTFTVTDSLGLSDATPDSRVITVSPQSGGGGTSLDRRVTSSSDDAEERSGSTSLSSSDLELTFDGQTQVIGIRFTSLAIPQGATITAAWIQFTAKETQSETTALTIHGQAADDAATFTSSALNVSSRPRTTSSVSWAPVAWSSIGQAGPNQRTPDLAPILREITGRTGWASGRALAFIITGTGHRTPYAYDGSSSSAPLLHVEFTTGGGSPNQAPNGTIDTPTSDVSITAGQSVSFSATGTDPDGNTPLSFAWDFGGGAANSTLEDPGSVTFSTPGTYTVRLTVKDSLALADPTPATRVITVATISGGTGGQNLVGNPSFEVNTNGWSAYGSATITRVAGGQDGAFCLEMRGPSSTSEFGLNDTPSWVTNTGAAGTTFRISAFVRSNAAHGTAKIRIREYLNGTQTGSTIYSAGVPLSAAWQILSRDYVTTRAGSSIDVQILDYPVASGEIFQTDTVSIQTVP
jgi:PKD repeat protein